MASGGMDRIVITANRMVRRAEDSAPYRTGTPTEKGRARCPDRAGAIPFREAQGRRAEDSAPYRLISKFVLASNMAAACAGALAAEAPLVFRDVAPQTGIVDGLRGMMGHAAAWGDVNGDGQLDLFVGTFADRPIADYLAGGADGPVPNRLLLQKDGKFARSDQPALAWRGRASGVVLADLDNDGWPDLYVSNNGRLGHQNLLYHNKGNGRFVEVTSQAGAPLQLPETSRSVSAADFDGDGLLDLLVLGTVRQSETMLFRNLGGMRFERSSVIPGDAQGLGLAIGDVTGNRWPDVFIGGCNRLFVNLGKGQFREAKELDLDWGFNNEGDSPACGAAFGDVDRDGDLDLLIGSHFKTPWQTPNAVRLFRNNDSSTSRVVFEEITEKVGVVKYPMKVPHVEIRDFDNDGWPDLYTALVTLRDGNTYPGIQRNLGLGKDGLPHFAETAFVHRRDFPGPEDLAPGQRTAVFYEKLLANRKVMYFAPGPSGDFDRDGRLDLFLCSWWPKFPSMLLRNETAGGNYLSVRVVGSKGMNRMGIGSMVRVYSVGKANQPGALLASEFIATGYGFCSAQPPVAHLGLGSAAQCDLVVSLPNTEGEMVLRNVAVNQQLTIDANPAGY